MSLPEAWVDRIFTKLSLTYGEGFMRTYAGLDVADVKANWGHELAGLAQSPKAIAHALEILPGRAPNVVEFRELCRRAPASSFGNQLPAPEPKPVDPAGVRKVAAALAGLKPTRPIGARAWAVRLQERHQRGDGLTRFQVAAYREALGPATQEVA